MNMSVNLCVHCAKKPRHVDTDHFCLETIKGLFFSRLRTSSYCFSPTLTDNFNLGWSSINDKMVILVWPSRDYIQLSESLPQLVVCIRILLWLMPLFYHYQSIYVIFLSFYCLPCMGFHSPRKSSRSTPSCDCVGLRESVHQQIVLCAHSHRSYYDFEFKFTKNHSETWKYEIKKCETERSISGRKSAANLARPWCVSFADRSCLPHIFARWINPQLSSSTIVDGRGLS